MKKILQYLMAFWLLGGGFVISLCCLVWSWKIALGILCAWLCIWIIMIMYWCFKTKALYLIKKDKLDKKAGEVRE